MPSKKKYNSRFPPGRIKKIMQTDEEVGKVAAPVPVIISRVLEIFIRNILGEANKRALSSQARTLQSIHLSQAIAADTRLHFLQDAVRQHSKSVSDHQDSGKSLASDNPSACCNEITQLYQLTSQEDEVQGTGDAPLQEAAEPFSNTDLGQLSSEMTGEACIGAAAASGRNKSRCRPPKRPVPDLKPIIPTAEPCLHNVPAKRGRGRPRKQPLLVDVEPPHVDIDNPPVRDVPPFLGSNHSPQHKQMNSPVSLMASFSGADRLKSSLSGGSRSPLVDVPWSPSLSPAVCGVGSYPSLEGMQSVVASRATNGVAHYSSPAVTAPSPAVSAFSSSPNPFLSGIRIAIPCLNTPSTSVPSSPQSPFPGSFTITIPTLPFSSNASSPSPTTSNPQSESEAAQPLVIKAEVPNESRIEDTASGSHIKKEAHGSNGKMNVGNAAHSYSERPSSDNRVTSGAKLVGGISFAIGDQEISVPGFLASTIKVDSSDEDYDA